MHELAATGSGACVGSTLAQIIAWVHRDRPELADVSRLYLPDPNRGGDGSFVYAFEQESGFALAFRRGGGDCPAGCTENEYWYFVTDDACKPEQIGHYRAEWQTGTCVTISGAPLWGLPQAPAPALVCGT